MTVDPAALIVGDFGVCGPSTLWLSSMLTSPAEADAYQAAAREPAASWQLPDQQVLEHNEAVLGEQWNAAVEARLSGRNLFVQPVLRLIVDSVEDALRLQQIGAVGPLRVTAHIGAMLGPWQWRWPLRVGVVASPEAARHDAQANGQARLSDQ
jgi:hypothetical protein